MVRSERYHRWRSSVFKASPPITSSVSRNFWSFLWRLRLLMAASDPILTGHQKLRNVDSDMEQSEALQLLDDFLAAVHFTGEGKGFHWTQAPCHETDLLPGKLLLSWQLWPQELQGNLHNFLVIVTEENLVSVGVECRYPGRSWWDLLSHQLEINNLELQRQGWAWLHRFPHQNSWVSSCPRG